jgi:hypothetical protein
MDGRVDGLMISGSTAVSVGGLLALGITRGGAEMVAESAAGSSDLIGLDIFGFSLALCMTGRAVGAMMSGFAIGSTALIGRDTSGTSRALGMTFPGVSATTSGSATGSAGLIELNPSGTFAGEVESNGRGAV